MPSLKLVAATPSVLYLFGSRVKFAGAIVVARSIAYACAGILVPPVIAAKETIIMLCAVLPLSKP